MSNLTISSFKEGYLRKGGLIDNILSIIQLFKEGGSIGNITPTSKTWYRMHRVKLEDHMHLSLCESHVFDYVNLCKDVYVDTCVL